MMYGRLRRFLYVQKMQKDDVQKECTGPTKRCTICRMKMYDAKDVPFNNVQMMYSKSVMIIETLYEKID